MGFMNVAPLEAVVPLHWPDLDRVEDPMTPRTPVDLLGAHRAHES